MERLTLDYDFSEQVIGGCGAIDSAMCEKRTCQYCQHLEAMINKLAEYERIGTVEEVTAAVKGKSQKKAFAELHHNTVTFVERPKHYCGRCHEIGARVMSEILRGKVPEGDNLVVVLDNGENFTIKPTRPKEQFEKE